MDLYRFISFENLMLLLVDLVKKYVININSILKVSLSYIC